MKQLFLGRNPSKFKQWLGSSISPSLGTLKRFRLGTFNRLRFLNTHGNDLSTKPPMMSAPNPVHLICLGVLPAMVAFAAEMAWANGSQIREKSIRSSSMALASDGLATGDAGALFSNPAAVCLAEQVTVTASFIYNEFSRDWSKGSSSLAQSASTKESTSSSGTIPQIFAMAPITDQLSFGWGVSIPFAGKVTDDESWFGRYHGTRTELSLLSIDGVLGYQINSHLSLGAGVSYQQAEFKMASAVDLATIAQLPSASADAISTFKGSSNATGFSLGFLYNPSTKWQVGLGWRSQVNHKIEGTNRWQDTSVTSQGIRDQLKAQSPTFNDQKAELSLPSPTQVFLAGKYQVQDQTNLYASLNYTDWSIVKNIDVKLKELGTYNRTQLNYHDTVSMSLGMDWQLSSEMVVRGGLGWDPELSNSADKEVRAADSNQTIIAFGAGFYHDTWQWDAGFNYRLIDDVKVDQKAATYRDNNLRGDVSGTSSSSRQSYMVGLTAKI